MKRGLLIIDRGSREKEAKDELENISRRIKEKGNYHYCDYCFLEVIPPFIEEGIQKAVKSGIDELTIVPYFLYPGKKIKIAVKESMRHQSKCRTKFLITKSMSMHKTMIKLVKNRIITALDENNQKIATEDADVLIVCHGSKDPNAQMSIKYLVDGLVPDFRNVSHCFLEIENPNISEGIEKCKKDSPRVLVIVFYFLHEGAHVKRDIYADLNPAVEKSKLQNSLVTKHIGTDEMMINLIIERAMEVENANKKRPIN